MNTLATVLAVLCVYRGTLTDGSGANPFSEPVERKMEFSVYESATGTTPLWRQTVEAVTIDKDGTFDTVFGNDELDQFFLTGQAKYIGLKVGDADSEIRPRRSFSSVASVSRASFAESLAEGGRVGTLFASAIKAEKVNASILEVSGKINASPDAKVKVAPFSLRDEDTTRLEHGKEVKVFAKDFEELSVASDKVHRGDILCYAPASGFAMIHQMNGSANRNLVIPAVIQFCRKGDAIRLPTETKDSVHVSFRKFVTE